MSGVTRYLARLFGLGLILLSLDILIDQPGMSATGDALTGDRPAMLTIALVTVIAGLATVLAHNVWIGDWRLIITLFGWLCAIGGTIRIIYPQLAIAVGDSVYSHPVAPLIAGIAMLILGFVLVYCGYAEEFEKLFKIPARKPRKRSKSS